MAGFYKFLIDLILAIGEKLFKASRPTSIEAEKPNELEDRLEDQIKKDGW